MTARIAPAEVPYPADVQAALDAVMRGRPPLVLFTTLARDPRLFHKFFAGGLLDRGHLTLRQRELVIDRTTAQCGSEYEWGVHIATFSAKAELTAGQIQSLVHGSAADACWSPQDALLIRLCDALHATCSIDDDLWEDLRSLFSEEAMLELLLLAGLLSHGELPHEFAEAPARSGRRPLVLKSGVQRFPDLRRCERHLQLR